MNVRDISRQLSKVGFVGGAITGFDIVVRNLAGQRVKKSAEEVARDALNRDQLKEKYDQVIDQEGKEMITVDRPFCSESTIEEFKNHLGDYTVELPFVARVSGGTLFGTDCFLLDDGDIVLESARARRDYLAKRFSRRPSNILHYMLTNGASATKHIDRCVISLAEERTTYHHWIFNQLSKLWMVNKLEEKLDINPVLIIPPEPPSYVTESLSAFGISAERILEWEYRSLSAEEVYVPTIPRIEGKRITSPPLHKYLIERKILFPSVCRWYRKKGKEISATNKNDSYSPKIIISREDVGRRTVKNKEKVYNFLYELGFEEYQLGEMSFVEQVRLFNNAEFIISPHGAGLSNLVFAEDCNVIEIIGEIDNKPTYHLLSSCAGHNYGKIIAEQNEKDGYLSISSQELQNCYQCMYDI